MVLEKYVFYPYWSVDIPICPLFHVFPHFTQTQPVKYYWGQHFEMWAQNQSITAWKPKVRFL